jgi:hypothetical protein
MYEMGKTHSTCRSDSTILALANMPHWSLLKAYCYFFSEGTLVMSAIDLPHALFSGDYSPIAPSSRPLIPSCSLIRCKPAQVYQNHLGSTVPLNPVYHIIYLGHYLVWALP